MPSIEDLKAGSKKPFTPTITVGEEDSKPNGNIPNSISMLSGEEIKHNRETADLSHLPKEDPLLSNSNIQLKVTKDFESEIFGKGGPFEKYVNEKIVEAQEGIAEIEAEREMAESEKMIQEYSNENIEEDEDDMDTTISEAKTLKQVDIFGSSNKYDNIEKEENIMSERSNNNKEQDLQYNTSDIFESPKDYNDEDDDMVLDLEEAVEEDHFNSYSNAEEVESVSIQEEPVKIAEEPKDPVKIKAQKKQNSVGAKIDKITRSYMEFNDDSLIEDEESVETQDDDDSLNELKSAITEKLNKVNKKLDLSSFTIAKKGSMSNNILKVKESPVAKWVLPTTGIVIQLREISGSNLEAIRSNLNRQPMPDIRGALKIIYDHIVSPKPESFEVWLKSIAYDDYDHLFMAVYIASFAETNYLPVDCDNPTCGKPFLTDSVPIIDMVNFKDDNAKEKFWNLYNSEPVNAPGLYATEIVSISDNIAMGFITPSLYSALIEPGYFNEQFMRRYSQTIDYLPYIDNIYYIDYDKQQLVPQEYKVYDNNISKTIRSKVQRYDKIINTLNADQNAIIRAYAQAIDERINWITYQIPETTCPKCGKVIEAQKDQTASSLVFLRNRLGALATI